MKRHLILLAIRCFLVLSVCAQVEAVTDSTVSLSQPVATGDTIQAIHQLFKAKRHEANLVTGVGVGAIGVGLLSLVPTFLLATVISSATGVKPDGGGIALFTLKFASPGLLITPLGLIKGGRFNKKKEEAVLLAYQEGRPIPPRIRRLLSKKHFQ